MHVCSYVARHQGSVVAAAEIVARAADNLRKLSGNSSDVSAANAAADVLLALCSGSSSEAAQVRAGCSDGIDIYLTDLRLKLGKLERCGLLLRLQAAAEGVKLLGARSQRVGGEDGGGWQWSLLRRL